MSKGIGRPYLSVVIPAYNEEARLEKSLPLIDAYCRQQGLDAEILVVDDGSTDSTGRRAADLLQGRRGRVLRVPENRGKGHAARYGMLRSQGRWVLLTDADLSTPIEEHATLAAAVRDRDLDVAIGSRGLPDSRVEIHQRRWRELGGKALNRLIRMMTGLPFHDTQCGFKLLDLERARPILERMVVDRFAFDVELLFLCVRFGLSVKEIPVVWRNDPRSTVNPFTDATRMLFDMLRIRWRFRRGLYNPSRVP